ncbi:1-deoxy-D-xylulose-5-phosphate synthase [Micromonospora sp. DR5-3]|uniref:1-deoxy-D-xylulose-5-phosphate synthase n=1 Tax=unclassified Micromonospora TaxID=2617518 RepID=UPI0011D91D38|nr:MULTISPECIES: 1-deoxy-D-xylulose-5-phosphate synthase [unclassified Micromonospora]MCW3816672.1 1-deoxy-D-xylulose-5-phosphate synthase [Micromonospora sp. DR5-3]TYC22537.1 1-deoxy-D-xylulose-5-phosphate synthase [Micromonospora sp. MP36]
MSLLDTVNQPDDLRRLTHDQLRLLAGEIRTFLVEAVCRRGGHLGPNLGMVELTIALHRVFQSPRDRIIFDTGHQAYVHKLLTGRQAGFAQLRGSGGLSGYPRRAESPHDLVENSHASTALSYATGLCWAYALDGPDRTVVAVIGDGALTGGLAWEALNNLAASPGRVVVVLNDNGRSYAPTVGGLAAHLASLRTGSPDRRDGSTAGSEFFQALGLSYLGPIDGHDVARLEAALRHAQESDRSVVVHCVTHKGHGHPPAEADEADRLHTVGVVDPATGQPTGSPGRTWTDVFAEELVAIGGQRPDLVAVSAAMLGPTGLTGFAARYPERTVDVGIAEQHAITSAAGLAFGGKHPVVAVYATFLNRAFDQVLLDVGLHRLPVTLVLDRAGITGPDGPSHHGMWDLAVLGTVPGLRVAAPRDAATLREELREAVDERRGPTVLRFPKARVDHDIPPVERIAGVDVLRRAAGAQVLLVAVGAMAGPTLRAADLLAAGGVECTVVDPRWVRPVNPELAVLAADHALVVTVEDGVREGGVGGAVAQSLADAAVATPVCALGLPTAFVPHGDRPGLLAEYGLDPHGICADVLRRLSWVGTGSREASRRVRASVHSRLTPLAG